MKYFFAFFVLVVAHSLYAQQPDPKIGYVYPAGGQRGTTLRVMVAGRQIARSTEAVVSGRGVRGRVVRGYQRMVINSAEENFVARQIYEAAKLSLEGPDDLPEEERRLIELVRERLTEQRLESLGLPKMLDVGSLPKPEEIIERFPYFDLLLEPTEESLQKIFYEYLAPRQDKKPKEAIGQGVLLELTISADAPPGDRDLRLFGPAGLTPPVRFIVGTLPEVVEIEPNDIETEKPSPLEMWGRRIASAPRTLKTLPPQTLPVVFNGQVRAGDVDRFRFQAKRGQKAVVDVYARYLVPYLADGVPGWFQANVSLFDPAGKKIAEAMSYRHDPDPVLLVEIPRDGIYSLEIQDSIFRGRDDFTYRITVGELPFVTSAFPLATPPGKTARADVDGWNLPEKVISWNGNVKSPGIYETKTIGRTPLTRPVRFAVDTLTEQIEKEPNGGLSDAMPLTSPVVVTGRISDENDVDCFTFPGVKGQHIVLDLMSRALDLPLDAALELLDSRGKIIASNDDRAGSDGPNIGLETHHADPYLKVELPEDGPFFVRIYDVTQRGGKDFGYRLRISPPRPDFAVYCEPSSIFFRRGAEPVKIHVHRHDGFQGEVQLRIAEDGNSRKNFTLTNSVVPGETGTAEMTLTAKPSFDGFPAELRLEAVAVMDGKEVVRPVIAVDDREQAFIYHHLVPAKSLVVARFLRGSRPNPSVNAVGTPTRLRPLAYAWGW